ncbi:MAG: TonB-dependent receptor plug domain-containing protein [Pseudomonadota bacterium]
MKRPILYLCFFLLLFISSRDGASAADNTYSGAYTLEEVVVSADQEGKNVEAVSTVREISADDLEVKDARTLDEALRMVPGIHVRTGGQGTPLIDLRGFKPRHVLLLLDGVPLNSTFDAQFDPSSIPVENIEKIKVTYSNSSVLYGQGGLGGVINIITKRGGQGVHGMVNEEIGEHIDHYGRYSLSGAGSNFDFFLSGSDYTSDGFELSRDFKHTKEENGGLRENSDKERKNFFAKIGYTPSDRWLFGMTLTCNKGEYGIPATVIDNPSDLFLGRTKYDRVDGYSGYSLQVSANYDAPGPWEIKSWFSINELDKEQNEYDDRHYNSMKNTLVKGTFHQDSTTSIMSLNLQAKCDLQTFGSFTIGLSGEKDSWEADGRMRDKLVAIGGVDPLTPTGPKAGSARRSATAARRRCVPSRP